MAAKTYLAMLMGNHCSLGQSVRPQSHSPGDWQGTLWQKCISQHVGKLLLEVACCYQLKLVTKRLYMHYKGCICIIALATSSCPQFAQKILICLQTTRFFAFRVKLYHCNRHISKVVTFTSLFLACIVLFFLSFSTVWRVNGKHGNHSQTSQRLSCTVMVIKAIIRGLQCCTAYLFATHVTLATASQLQQSDINWSWYTYFLPCDNWLPAVH